MASRSKVAVLRTQPETVLDDYGRLFELAGGPQALDPRATTILKDNISWHYPMPGAKLMGFDPLTTPTSAWRTSAAWVVATCVRSSSWATTCRLKTGISR
jgi:hypothetical protein